jgi:hypothetical protein
MQQQTACNNPIQRGLSGGGGGAHVVIVVVLIDQGLVIVAVAASSVAAGGIRVVTGVEAIGLLLLVLVIRSVLVEEARPATLQPCEDDNTRCTRCANFTGSVIRGSLQWSHTSHHFGYAKCMYWW